MFFHAQRIRESRLEPIRLSPKERQKTPEMKKGMFISAQFQRKQSQEKRALDQRPRSSLSMIPRAIKITSQYTYYCESGNNGAVVKRVMQTRPWFAEQQTNFNVNLIWKQTSRGVNFAQLSSQKKVVVNHLENHVEISNKNKLYENLKYHCLKIKLNMDEFVPTTYIINLDSQTLSQDLKKFIDHFVSIRKEGSLKNVWLLKPPDLNRGRGIQLFNDIKVFISQVEDFCRVKSSPQAKKTPKGQRQVTICYPDPTEKSGQSTVNFIMDPSAGHDRIIVVQKYLENPLLYNGRKFDFRFWVLIDQNQKYYLFKEGYLRLATDNFDIINIKNLYIHLTNNAIQKYHPQYGKYELGNQLSLSDLQQYLSASKNIKVSTTNSLLSKIKELVHQTIHSANGKLRDVRRDYQFELFGYDFMVDRIGNIWLIEINTNPCIEESSPLLQKLIPRMLNDAFRITIDRIFAAPKDPIEFNIPGYPDKENLWELLGQI